MAEETPKQWTSDDEAELDRQIREADEILRSAPRISSETMQGPQEGAAAGGYDTGVEVAVGEGDESGRTKRTSAAREVRIMDDGSAEIDVYEKGRDGTLIRRVRKLKQGDAIFNDAGRKFYSNKPHLQGRWTWDESRQDFIKDGVLNPQAPTQRDDAQTPFLKGQQPGESDEAYEARLLREQEELLKQRDATQTDVDKSTKASIKKRARKRVVLGRKSDDSQDDTGDDTSTGIRPGTQERLKDVLALRKEKYNIPDDVIKSLSDQIDAASTAADLQAIEDQINKDFGTEYGKKKTGKRKSARTGSGDIDVGEKKGRKVSMERMPDGRMKFITIEPDGTTTERIEGEEARTTNAVFEETPPQAWEEFGRMHGDSMREEERAATARAEQDARYREEIARWENRGPVKRFFDLLRGVQPPRAPEVYTLLNTPGLSPEVREAILATEQATRAMYARQDRDAADRGVSSRWDRIKGRFKGAGKVVLFGVTAATVFGLFATGAGIPAALTLPKLLGVVAGGLTSTYVRNANEEAGRNGFMGKYLMPWLVGTLAGVGTGAIATGISDLISSQFGNGKSVHALAGGPSQAAPAAPAGAPGMAQMIPTPPPGFDTGDFGALGNKLIVSAGDNIWSQVTDGLCEQSLLDTKGRAAFADAFYRTVEDGRFKDLFLSYNGRPLGQGVFWNNLPVGTVANYERLFSNPQFVDMLVDRIGDNYPSLLRKINSGGFSAFDFIRGVAYSHGVKI